MLPVCIICLQLLQGVFSALGGLGQPAGTAAAAAPQAPEPTHLLRSIDEFLQQLQSAAAGPGGDLAMPVTSLALGGTAGALLGPMDLAVWCLVLPTPHQFAGTCLYLVHFRGVIHSFSVHLTLCACLRPIAGSVCCRIVS